VADTGIGMDEKRLRIVFERFRQGDDTISSKYGGTGLGLAISRELAALTGGGYVDGIGAGTRNYFLFHYPK